MYCIHCGKELIPGTKYCVYCGEKIRTVEPPTEKPYQMKVDGKRIYTPVKQAPKKKKQVPFWIILLTVLIALVIDVGLVLLFVRGWHKESQTASLMADDGTVLSLYTPGSDSVSRDERNGIQYVNNELLVTVSPDTTKEELEAYLTEYDGRIAGENGYLKQYQVVFEDSYTYDELSALAQKVQNSDIIVGAAQDLIVNIELESMYPNDSKWANLWETSPGGRNWGAEAIHAPEMWETALQRGTVPVNVGVLDNQFFTGHDDLKFEEVFYNNYSIWEKKADHGTHVAGTIAATFNNGIGIPGIAANVNLYGASYMGYESEPIQENTDGVSVSCIEAGLAYLICMKECKVINISLHWGPESKEKTDFLADQIVNCLHSFLDSGYEFLIVKGAGNDCADADGYYDILHSITDSEIKDRMIIVGAAELAGNDIQVWPDSNYGTCIDLIAPGADIYSCCKSSVLSPDGYCTKSGTSMATPHVSGVAATLWSLDPDLSGADVKKILCSSAQGSYKYAAAGMDSVTEDGITYSVQNLIGIWSWPMLDGYAAVRTLLEEEPDDARAENAPSADEQGITEPSTYEAYLQTLLNARGDILRYTWKSGGRTMMKGNPDCVVITDICGDGIPELIFVKAEPDEYNNVVYTTLNIVTFQDGKIKTLYSAPWDTKAGGGFYYTLYQVQGDPSLRAYIRTGDEAWTNEYDVFLPGDNGMLTRSEVCREYRYPMYDQGNYYRLTEYSCRGSECTHDDYLAQSATEWERMSDVLMTTDPPEGAGASSCTAMTVDEAIIWLKAQLGIQERDISSYIGNWVCEAESNSTITIIGNEGGFVNFHYFLYRMYSSNDLTAALIGNKAYFSDGSSGISGTLLFGENYVTIHFDSVPSGLSDLYHYNDYKFIPPSAEPITVKQSVFDLLVCRYGEIKSQYPEAEPQFVNNGRYYVEIPETGLYLWFQNYDWVAADNDYCQGIVGSLLDLTDNMPSQIALSEFNRVLSTAVASPNDPENSYEIVDSPGTAYYISRNHFAKLYFSVYAYGFGCMLEINLDSIPDVSGEVMLEDSFTGRISIIAG